MTSQKKLSQSSPITPWKQTLAILCIGLGIGWMIGLSISPIVKGVITSLLALGAGLIAVIQVIPSAKQEEAESRHKIVSAVPAALLITSVALAATLGMTARTYHIFEPQLNYLNEKKIEAIPQTPIQSPQNQGVLFAEHQNTCSRLMYFLEMENDKGFLEELQQSELPGLKLVTERYSDDPETMKTIIRLLCTHYIRHD